MILNLDAVEYRRRLAGLSDVTGGQSRMIAENRELSSDLVLLLAMVFNRDQLDAVTLWTRIESAIQRGIAASNGDDVERFLSVCFEHVIADVNKLVSGKAFAIQCRLMSLSDEQRVAFLQYLNAHRYVAISVGCEKWNAEKSGGAA